MITLTGLPELIAFIGASDADDWVHVKTDDWENHPVHCEFLIMSDDELEQLYEAGRAQEIDGLLWPDEFTEKGIRRFLTFESFRGIIWALEGAELDWDDELLATAINHFLAHDSFMEHPARA